ncbi:Target of rapamycin [Smittium culicis]|uniref:Serine/threonine-protein kinase TOR n=1 Tax=Smittium culicis TaxID=133412 RepID=A0A1R1Y052_9FUNG|nr:Target of rapamycin [Smittium culicis]
MVLGACCRAAPTFMTDYLSRILEALRDPIRDSKIQIRTEAVNTLTECMKLISSRDLKTRNQMYQELYDGILRDLKIGTSEAFHGILLVCEQLFYHSGMFMQSRYSEVAEFTIRLCDHPDFMLRKQAIILLPILAEYSPSDMNARINGNDSFMQRSMNLLIPLTKRSKEQQVAFESIGKISLSTKQLFTPYLSTTFDVIRDYLFYSHNSNQTKNLSSAFNCISDIAISLGPAIVKHIQDLLDIMLMVGLIPPLCESLKILKQEVSQLSNVIQERLLDMISIVLVGKPFYIEFFNSTHFYKSPTAITHTSSDIQNKATFSNSTSTGEPSKNLDEVILALKTLGTFGFEEKNLSEFVRNDVLVYISSEEVSVRREAIIAVSEIVSHNPYYWQQSGPSVEVSNDIIQHIIAVSITDDDPNIRLLAVSLFLVCDKFDFHLGKAENIGSLLMMLNDESFNICEVMVSVVCRLTQTNPAHVIPSLRRLIVQLLTQLEFSNSSQEKENCIKLLMAAVESAEQWIKPYVIEILDSIIPKISDAKPRLASKYLDIISSLAIVGRESLIPYTEDIIQIVSDALSDQSSLVKRLAGLKALGSCARYCGMVSKPFIDHPELLDILITMFKGEENSKVRNEIITVIGNIGAVDPYEYQNKLNDLNIIQSSSALDYNIPKVQDHSASKLDGRDKTNEIAGKKSNTSYNDDISGSSKNYKHGVVPAKKDFSIAKIQKQVSDIPLDSLGSSFTTDDYHVKMAIYSLLRILTDSKLTELHTDACQAILMIFSSLGLSCAKYLKDVVPSLMFAMKVGGFSQKEFYLEQLGRLVAIEKQLIRPYLGEVFNLFKNDLGSTPNQQSAAIALIEVVAEALVGDFGSHLSTVLPFLLDVIEKDQSETRNPTLRVLHALRIISPNLDPYLLLTIPRIVSLLDFRKQTVIVIDSAIQTISSIVLAVNCRTFASCIVLSLVRLYRNAPTLQIQNQIMDLFCVLMQQLMDDFVLFMPAIHNVVQTRGTEKQHVEYERCSRNLFSNRLAPSEPKILHPTLQVEPNENKGNLYRDTNRRLKPNTSLLRRAWATSRRVTKEDWVDWIKQLSVELLKEAASPALRACALLASRYPQLGEDLFNSAFVSCFSEIPESEQNELVRAIDIAAGSPQMPPEILQAILNLAEYMERDEKPIPVSIEKLGDYALSCHALAKALHYKEIEYSMTESETVIQDLISLNQQLDQPDAAIGSLAYVRTKSSMLSDRAEWHIRLEQWDEALAVYKSISSSSQEMLQIKDSNFSLALNNSAHGYSDTSSIHNPNSEILRGSLVSITNNINPDSLDNLLGEMRCYYHLSNWDSLLPLLSDVWNFNEEVRPKVASIGVNMAWALGDMDMLEKYLKYLPSSDQKCSFFRALLAVHNNNFDEARKYISISRANIDKEMSAQLSESFQRGYSLAIYCQMLSELEEVILYKSLEDSHFQKKLIIKTWEKRLEGCQKDVGNWQHFLQIRSLVLPRTRILEMWVEFMQMCLNSNKLSLCDQTLRLVVSDEFHQRKLFINDKTLNKRSGHHWLNDPDILVWKNPNCSKADDVYLNPSLNFYSPKLTNSNFFDSSICNEDYKPNINKVLAEEPRSIEKSIESSIFPELMLTFYKYKWENNEKSYAISQINNLRKRLSFSVGFDFNSLNFDENILKQSQKKAFGDGGESINLNTYDRTVKLLSELYYTEAKWKMVLLKHESESYDKSENVSFNSDSSMTRILSLLEASTILNRKSYISWHSFALRHYEMTQNFEREDNTISTQMVDTHIIPSIHGFFKAIQLSNMDTTLQDTLRLLTVWFNYGHIDSVAQAISSRFNDVKITTWIQVMPQILARIHTPHENVRRLIVQLLVDVGKSHPQAILFSLTVASKSTLVQRKKTANNILEKLRDFSPTLIEQTDLVSTELVRVAILWAEMWNEALEDASRLYFSKGDSKGMLAKLMPLHALIRRGPETLREVHFIQAFGRELNEAEEWCNRFSETLDTNPNTNFLRHAWDVYYSVFRRIERSLKQMTTLNLNTVSPKLLACNNLQLAVPGSYSPNQRLVSIQSFNPQLYIYSSKQRPRRMLINGDDGNVYTFLLKGHEDLRQDERVMQLFDLINNLLSRDPDTSRRHLKIERFPVIPLSPDSGLIGFYPNCDTLHSLIKSYRETSNTVINAEHRHMLQFAPDYDNCTILEKVEAFEYSMERAKGDDLQKILWYKSYNAEEWLGRRTNYTRSLAVMSIAGYILGLGDRHPSNLMIHSSSGKVVHIDFGDCFEVAITREKFPETVPFRLTRMLVNAMELNGIQGSFKITTQHTMRVLRSNKDSLMAVLEAFVYDPLVSWHYLKDKDEVPEVTENNRFEGFDEIIIPFVNQSLNKSDSKNEDIMQDQWQMANPKAIAITKRILNKLTGRDFNPTVTLDVTNQVENLIKQATLIENLCQCYVGWCAFW